MRGFLLDSHILLWYRAQPEKLSQATMATILQPENAVYYSVVTPWELGIKHAKGKLDLVADFFEKLPHQGFDCLPILESHVTRLRQLPPLHDDPFDRMLVAQAMEERLTLITADRNLAAYGMDTMVVES